MKQNLRNKELEDISCFATSSSCSEVGEVTLKCYLADIYLTCH